MHLPRNILVPTDFSDNASDALDYAVALAAKLDAKVHVLHVIGMPVMGVDYAMDTGTMISSLADGAQIELDHLVTGRAEKVAFGPTLLRTGDPRDVIDASGKDVNADLIVMGSQGRRGIARLLLGSVAESVARTAACPVLLVRAGHSTRPPPAR